MRSVAAVVREYWLFFLLPGIVLGCSAFLKMAVGPYWLSTNMDPAYSYFVNGVYLLKGFVPNLSEHPGTPLQMLCGLVCWMFNAGRPLPEVIARALTEPEFYLQAVSWILVGGCFLTAVLLAVYVYRKSGDRLAALLTQLPVFAFVSLRSWETADPVLPVVANVNPEPLLIVVVNLFNFCLVYMFFARSRKDEMAAVLLWGLVCGAGAAVKLTFLPLLLVPFMVLSWKQKGIFLGVFLGSFLLWTLPIWPRYVHLWQWASALVMHTGAHGAGSAGVIDIHGFGLALLGIMKKQWLFAGMALSALGLAFARVLGRTWDKGTFFLLAAALGALAQFMVVAKHPGPHYLVPGLGSFGVIFAFLYWQWPSRFLWGRRMTAVFIAVFVLAGAGQAMAYGVQVRDFSQRLLAFHEKVRAKYAHCQFLGYYRCSGKEESLNFGDSWNLTSSLGEDLGRLYPGRYFFHVWARAVFDFKARVWSDDLLASSPCVVFQGTRNFDFSQSPYTVRLLESGPLEDIYLLTATGEKARAFYTAALQLAQMGDYQRALSFALQARAAHYQPADRLESLIQAFSSRIQR